MFVRFGERCQARPTPQRDALMTMPFERTRALLQAREFLWELVYGEAAQLPPEKLREQAKRLLRHFPRPGDVRIAHLAAPDWFGPPPTGEDPG